MAEKKLTPLQEAIEVIKKSLLDNPTVATGETYNNGLKRAINHIQSLLPKEKEFAKEMWDAALASDEYLCSGQNYAPDFKELYKQYEP